MPVKVAVPPVSANREDRLGGVFECELRPGDGHSTWVHVAGDLDMSTAPQLALALRQAAWWRLIVVDLRAVSFLDTSGVHVIVDASVRARRVERQLVVTRGPVQVDRLFGLCGVSDAVTIIDLDRPGGLTPGVPPRNTPPDEAA